MPVRSPTTAAVLVLALALLPHAASAQKNPALQDQIDLLKQQVELAQQRTMLNAEELKNAKVVLDQLPKFEGKTTTDAATGKFESTQLAARALAFVAGQIADTAEKEPTLVLTGDEKFAFGLPSAINAEMRWLHDGLVAPEICGGPCLIGQLGTANFDPGTAVGIVTAVTGMLRSDVELKSLTDDAITSRMLADAVAVGINMRAPGTAQVLGGSPGVKVEPKNLGELDNNEPWAEPKDIARKYAWLLTARVAAQRQANQLGATAASRKAHADRIAALKQWLNDFDAFDAKAAKPSDMGMTPVGAAVQAEALETGLTRLLRVDIAMAGGSLKNAKNIVTYLGGDPLRVTGGVVATYRTYDVSQEGGSRPTGWGVWACGSDPVRLGRVRKARFSIDENARGGPPCQRIGVESANIGGVAQRAAGFRRRYSAADPSLGGGPSPQGARRPESP